MDQNWKRKAHPKIKPAQSTRIRGKGISRAQPAGDSSHAMEHVLLPAAAEMGQDAGRLRSWWWVDAAPHPFVASTRPRRRCSPSSPSTRPPPPPFAGLYRSTRSPPASLPSAKLHQTTVDPSALLLELAFKPPASSCRLGSRSGSWQRRRVWGRWGQRLGLERRNREREWVGTVRLFLPYLMDNLDLLTRKSDGC
jgi:hypothetical protein